MIISIITRGRKMPVVRAVAGTQTAVATILTFAQNGNFLHVTTPSGAPKAIVSMILPCYVANTRGPLQGLECVEIGH